MIEVVVERTKLEHHIISLPINGRTGDRIMASNKQLEANRANARRSTGPRTEEGKVRSRANSWKHGLTANRLVIGGEEASEFDELRAALLDDHDPQSAFECELVERLAGIL